MTATLWVPGPLPNLNDLIDAAKGAGGRGARYSKLKKVWTETVWARAKQALLPRFAGRVTFEFLWVVADRRTDPDNTAAGGRKVVLDGLVMAQVIPGDGWKYVRNWSDDFALVGDLPDRLEPGVLVRIADHPTVAA